MEHLTLVPVTLVVQCSMETNGLQTSGSEPTDKCGLIPARENKIVFGLIEISVYVHIHYHIMMIQVSMSCVEFHCEQHEYTRDLG